MRFRYRMTADARKPYQEEGSEVKNVFITMIIGLAWSSPCLAGTTTEIFFDGDEPGVDPGGGDFSFGGATFIQGVVSDLGPDSLRASGSFSWLPQSGIAGNAVIEFDTPVSEVSFFFVHDAINVGSGAVGGVEVGNDIPTITAFSNEATFFGDPGNFVTLASDIGITELQFVPLDGLQQPGSVDNFAFTFIPAPAVLAVLAAGGVAAPLRRRRT